MGRLMHLMIVICSHPHARAASQREGEGEGEGEGWTESQMGPAGTRLIYNNVGRNLSHKCWALACSAQTCCCELLSRPDCYLTTNIGLYHINDNMLQIANAPCCTSCLNPQCMLWSMGHDAMLQFSQHTSLRPFLSPLSCLQAQLHKLLQWRSW